MHTCILERIGVEKSWCSARRKLAQRRLEQRRMSGGVPCEEILEQHAGSDRGDGQHQHQLPVLGAFGGGEVVELVPLRAPDGEERDGTTSEANSLAVDLMPWESFPVES